MKILSKTFHDTDLPGWEIEIVISEDETRHGFVTAPKKATDPEIIEAAQKLWGFG